MSSGAFNPLTDWSPAHPTARMSHRWWAKTSMRIYIIVVGEGLLSIHSLVDLHSLVSRLDIIESRKYATAFHDMFTYMINIVASACIPKTAYYVTCEFEKVKMTFFHLNDPGCTHKTNRRQDTTFLHRAFSCKLHNFLHCRGNMNRHSASNIGQNRGKQLL